MIINQHKFLQKQINEQIMKTKTLEQQGINTVRILAADAVQHRDTEA